MPVGEFAYQGREGKHTCVHTECMAQVLTKEAQRDEEVRNEREQQKKILNRREYDIGWRMDTVPQNLLWQSVWVARHLLKVCAALSWMMPPRRFVWRLHWNLQLL